VKYSVAAKGYVTRAAMWDWVLNRRSNMPTSYDEVSGAPTYKFPTETKEDFEAINTPSPLDPTGDDESKFDRIEKMLIGLADKVDRIEKFLDARPKLFGNDGTAEVSGAVSGAVSGDTSAG
jgi:hypothetical protein